MKSIYSIILFIIISLYSIQFKLFAQNIDYNKIILPIGLENLSFEEKLVQLAWSNHPDNKVVRLEKDISLSEAKQLKTEWLNQIRASGNLNEFTINPDATPNNFFLPRYNFSLTLPLGIIFQQPLNNKIANGEIAIANERINKQKIKVRYEVLEAYQDYILQKELYSIRNNLAEDEYTNLYSIESKFKKGEVSIEEYRTATKTYSNELEKKLNAKKNLEISKLKIESLIGIPLELVD
jgi:outer membrane protein TolC